MLIFVSGGSASGKSALAERICCALPGDHYYIATMPVRDAEDERVVARHHALRAERGFVGTLEMPGRPDFSAIPPDATALLECLSTFVANRMFEGGGAPEPAGGWADALWDELLPLLDRSGHTVIVSADVSGDGVDYGPETEAYRRTLAALGVRLCERADAAVEAVCGRAKLRKGPLPPLAPPVD